jgi:hypothetical protein
MQEIEKKQQNDTKDRIDNVLPDSKQSQQLLQREELQ